MSSYRWLIPSLLAATTLLSVADARAEQAVVLASSAPGFGRGQIVDGTRVEIADGASVVFVLKNGRTVTVKGPHAGPLPAATGGGSAGLSRLLGRSGQDMADLGGARSLRPSDPATVVDTNVDDRWCRTANETPRLAAPAAGPVSAVLVDKATGRRTAVSWPGNGASVVWPAPLPQAERAEFAIEGVPGKPAKSFTIVTVQPEAAGRPSLAVAMAMAGCAKQAASLLDKVRADDTPLDLYLTTDRGRYPTYRSGEPIGLLLQSNRDAFVYCFGAGANRRPVLLFPSTNDNLPIPAEQQVRLQDSQGAKGAVAGTTISAGEVRCIAADRDLSAEVRELASTGSMAPISAAALAALENVVDAHASGGVALARLTLQVTD